MCWWNGSGEQTQRLAAVDQGCFCVPDQLFRTAYTIMAYHNDVGINEVFTEVYRMAMGAEPGGLNTLEVFYSLGLAAGLSFSSIMSVAGA